MRSNALRLPHDDGEKCKTVWMASNCALAVGGNRPWPWHLRRKRKILKNIFQYFVFIVSFLLSKASLVSISTECKMNKWWMALNHGRRNGEDHDQKNRKYSNWRGVVIGRHHKSTDERCCGYILRWLTHLSHINFHVNCTIKRIRNN